MMGAPQRYASTVYSFRVMTFNIRMETSEKDPGDDWSARRAAVSGFLAGSGADVIGLQEVTPSQLWFLGEELAKHGYAHVGDGREKDGRGEASPIFYLAAAFEAARVETRWLSETPGTPGSWLAGAKCCRVVTCVALRRPRRDADGDAEAEICCFNSHFDHAGMERSDCALPVQRREAEILLGEVERFCPGGGLRVLLGDFNSWRGVGAPPVLLAAGYLDASSSGAQPDDEATFVGFRTCAAGEREEAGSEALWGDPAWQHIDWVFVGPGLQVGDYRVHKDRYTDWRGATRSLSDHLPVSARLTLASEAEKPAAPCRSRSRSPRSSRVPVAV